MANPNKYDFEFPFQVDGRQFLASVHKENRDPDALYSIDVQDQELGKRFGPKYVLEFNSGRYIWATEMTDKNQQLMRDLHEGLMIHFHQHPEHK